LPPLDRPQHFAFGCHYRKSGSAQSCRSRKLSTLRRNFPEADIRAGAQHFATLDDCNADKDEAALAAMVLVAGVLR
jgi:hypothetical protein